MYSNSHKSPPLRRIAFSWFLAGAFLWVGSLGAEALPSRVLTSAGELAHLAASEDGASGLSLLRGADSFLVPGTDDAASETALGLISSRSERITAIWLRWTGETATLSFATLTADQWDGPYSLVGGGEPIALRQAPILAVGEQSSRVTLDAETTVDLERQVAHVVWTEEGARVRYSPLIFNDGHFVGWNEIVTLTSAFRGAHENAEPLDVAATLPSLLGVRESASDDLFVTLADPEFGRVGTLRIGTVPLVLEILGNSIFDHVLDSADLLDPEDVSLVADEIRGHIVHVGSSLDLDPDIAGFLSARVGDWLLENGAQFGWDLLGLAGALRANSLDISRSVYSLSVPYAAGDGEITLIDIIDLLDDNGHRNELADLVSLQLTADFASPATLPEDHQVHLAKDGSALAFSWREEGQLRWIENRGAGWGEAKSLAVTDSLDEAKIRELIEASIR